MTEFLFEKRICFFANTSWYLFNFRYSTVEQFSRRGFDVVCMAGDDEYFDKFVDLGVGCYRVPLKSYSKNIIFELWSVFKIWKSLKIRPNYLFTFTPKANLYGVLVGRARKIKVVVNVAGGIGSRPDPLGSSVSNLFNFLYQWVLGFADHIFVQNSQIFDFTLRI